MADSIYEQRFDPVKQAAIAIAGVLAFQSGGQGSSSSAVPWRGAAFRG